MPKVDVNFIFYFFKRNFWQHVVFNNAKKICCCNVCMHVNLALENKFTIFFWSKNENSALWPDWGVNLVPRPETPIGHPPGQRMQCSQTFVVENPRAVWPDPLRQNVYKKWRPSMEKGKFCKRKSNIVPSRTRINCIEQTPLNVAVFYNDDKIPYSLRMRFNFRQ